MREKIKVEVGVLERKLEEAEQAKKLLEQTIQDQKERRDQAEGELSDQRHAAELERQQNSHKASGLEMQLRAVQDEKQAAVELHEQVARRLHEESLSLQQVRQCELASKCISLWLPISLSVVSTVNELVG